MGHPMNFVLSILADRHTLVADVTRVAEEQHVAVRDCWEYILEAESTPGWMRIIAKEEIERNKQGVRDFFDFVNNLK